MPPERKAFAVKRGFTLDEFVAMQMPTVRD